MAKNYSKEFKSSIITRMLSPYNERVPDLVKETGVPKDTLYAWRAKYRTREAHDTAMAGCTGSRALNTEEKLEAVILTAQMNEVEIGEYCRRNGLYPDQILAWKKMFVNGTGAQRSKADRELMAQQNKRINELEKDLRRKEKALAEAAALLVLEKKLQAFLEESEERKQTSKNAKKSFNL